MILNKPSKGDVWVGHDGWRVLAIGSKRMYEYFMDWLESNDE